MLRRKPVLKEKEREIRKDEMEKCLQMQYSKFIYSDNAFERFGGNAITSICKSQPDMGIRQGMDAKRLLLCNSN
jgi:hypothetical protein